MILDYSRAEVFVNVYTVCITVYQDKFIVIVHNRPMFNFICKRVLSWILFLNTKSVKSVGDVFDIIASSWKPSNATSNCDHSYK